jgi:hypothetical protein
LHDADNKANCAQPSGTRPSCAQLPASFIREISIEPTV